MSHLRLTSVNLDLPIGGNSLSALFKPSPAVKSSGRIDRNKQGQYCKVLHDISLAIKSGERVGLIGVNGAGKSSLLRVLAGIYAPTQGVYEANGKISTLFAATVGMNADASGRENIFLSARTLGLSRAQIAAVKNDIIEFAQLGDFIDFPIRLYSAGMKMRLGFAIATAIQPEILLVDEVFGAGDAPFRERANERIKRIMEKAGLLVMATHSEQVIKSFCERVIWLHQGQVNFDGPTKEGMDLFRQSGK
jgi:ABC-type polysaccharide/polyol phosphate transport system ATPase subunit